MQVRLCMENNHLLVSVRFVNVRTALPSSLHQMRLTHFVRVVFWLGV